MKHKSLRVVDLKADDSRPGLVSGRASVYHVVDSYNDLVMPGAFTKTLQEKGGRIVVLSQHDPSQSIGLATLVDKADGLHCQIQLELEISQARDDYARVKAGLVTGISIGYECLRDEIRRDGVRLLRECSLGEPDVRSDRHPVMSGRHWRTTGRIHHPL